MRLNKESRQKLARYTTMAGGKNNTNGYTIVETLIFLAVSSALLVAAMVTIGGRQNSTRFSQSIRQVQSEIDVIMNDVATGYYQRNNEIDCDAGVSGKPVTAGTGTNQIGTNAGCIFLGRIMHFSPDNIGNNNTYKTYSVVGRQFKAGPLSDIVTSYGEAAPIRLPGNTDSVNLSEGLTIKSMKINGTDKTGAVGFFAGLDQYSFDSGGQSTSLIGFPGTELGDAPVDISSVIETPASYAVDKPIILCFDSGTTNEHGIISIGDVQGRLATTLTINSGKCPL